MEPQQIFILVAGLLLVTFYVKRRMSMNSINQYSPALLEEAMRNDDILLLDVRTAAERAQSKISPSVHIPVHQVSSRSDELMKFIDREIICYCASGARSVSAAIALKKKGFKVGNLRGGIGDWNFYIKTK